MSVHLVSGNLDRELPIDFDLLVIAFFDNCQDFILQLLNILLVFIGMILGMGTALATTRLVSSMLFGMSPYDPMTIALSSLLLLTIAALASY
jgi:hypothetical protein